MLKQLEVVAASYFLGSIPFGYILVRVFRGEDVRQSGSGNIGATNVSRKSPVLGVLTLLLDALKGSAAVMLAEFLYRPVAHPYQIMAMAAFFAVAGHMFPVWLSFRGGKGVATGLGAFAIIAPKAVLMTAAIFLATALAFRYISLASIVAVTFFPALVWFLDAYGSVRMALVLIALTALLIVIRHYENIQRLIFGTEPRFGSRLS